MFNRKIGKMEMIIGEHSRITGDVESSGTVLVEGTILGSLKGCKVILGEKAYVKGDISADSISIAGRLEGNLHGRESVVIKGTAKISGDIATKMLSLAEGAIFNGFCRMDSGEANRRDDTEKNVVDFASLER